MFILKCLLFQSLVSLGSVGFILNPESSDGSQCQDLSPRDCSNPEALARICPTTVAQRFCKKSCGLCTIISPTVATTTTTTTTTTVTTTTKSPHKERYMYIGGIGGLPFDDKPYFTYGKITGMMMECTDRYVFKIKMRYGQVWANIHGGDGRFNCPRILDSLNRTYVFAKHEKLTGVTLTHSIDLTYGVGNVIIESITFMTNVRTLPPCGYVNLTTQSSTTIGWERLNYISGKIGCLLDGLGFHWIDKQ